MATHIFFFHIRIPCVKIRKFCLEYFFKLLVKNAQISQIKFSISVFFKFLIFEFLTIFTFFDCIEFQLDNIAIGIIIVVNNTKYIDKPSTPK